MGGRGASSSSGGISAALRSALVGRAFDDVMKHSTKEEIKTIREQIHKKQGQSTQDAIREKWREVNMQESVKGIHELSQEEAAETLRKSIPQEVHRGWFVNADSDYKPKIEEALLTNKAARNAALNISWRNYNAYLETQGKPPIGFKKFVNTPIKVYRGDQGQTTLKNDVFKAYTYEKSVAEKFGSHITTKTIKPINTLGGGQTTGEYELLVPKKGG